jgi:hypothetical protein
MSVFFMYTRISVQIIGDGDDSDYDDEKLLR